jgi:hypothetical protein
MHAQGITGQGVGIAIIDNPLLVDHEEYAGRLRLYEENGLQTLFIDLKFEHYQQMLDKRAEALEKGHAAFWLEGRKLKGGYAITRTSRGWILVKMKDEEVKSGDILKAEPRSVLSERTIEEMATESASNRLLAEG